MLVDRGEVAPASGFELHDYVAIFSSAFIHMVVLLVLGVCILQTAGDSNVTISAVFDSDAELTDELEQFEFELETAVDLPDSPVDELDPLDLGVPENELVEFDIPLFRPDEATADVAAVAESVSEPEAPSIESLSSSTSVESAVDQVTAKIKGQLENGDLLVVWMLDASHSLVDDRKRVAARLEPFFEEIAASRGEDAYRLANAVVSFGNRMRERVAPTDFGKRVVNAVENLPVDASGKENIFAAIDQCVPNYRSKWRNKKLMIVVWTDESGDDVNRLEQTIRLCQQNDVIVSVVGPSSVLGADTGLHSYTDPKSNQVFQLPVQRGPDTATPERVELGYWFRARPPFSPGGFMRGRRRMRLPSWYGGNDLAGIASGFSPYALTRLAMQTGGSYTIFDRPEDRGPFEPATMRAYAPAYVSADSYQQSVDAHPLRRAVHSAVKATLGKKLDAPELMFFVKRDKSQPLNLIRYYFSPTQFAGKLRSAAGAQKRLAQRNARFVELALAAVSEDGDVQRGLEYEYDRESSKRWRAWYDLTRGRLLATSVRLEEYRLTWEAMTEPGFLNDTTNHLMMMPSSNMKSESRFRQREEEAERLLRRCASENPDTPWAYLAQRELANALGIEIRQMALQPTSIIRGGGSAPSLPKF